MKKYLIEFIGTFFLVITVITTVGGSAGSFAPIAIGTILMVMVFAGGHISGAHYNPAVTLGVYLRGKCPGSDVIPYIVAQLAASIAAALLGGFLVGHVPNSAGISSPAPFEFLPGLLAEFLGTFALVFVVLNTATAKGTAGNSFYGLAIGFTVMACAYGLGGVSGGAFNPAVAVGISFAGLSEWANIGAFLIGQLGAAALAAYIFTYVNGKE